MSEVRIAATPRTEFGKGGARRTRRAGNIPAVLYGHGTDPRHISLPARDFWRALRTDAGNNVLLTVAVEGDELLALPKAIQRDPLSQEVEHVDLLLVRRGEKVQVDVPIVITGTPVSGTMVQEELTSLAVEADATNLPQNFEVSVEGLDVGAVIHTGDIQLPEGSTLAVDPELIVLSLLSMSAQAAAQDAAGETVVETETADAEPGAEQ